MQARRRALRSAVWRHDPSRAHAGPPAVHLLPEARQLRVLRQGVLWKRPRGKDIFLCYSAL